MPKLFPVPPMLYLILKEKHLTYPQALLLQLPLVPLLLQLTQALSIPVNL